MTSPMDRVAVDLVPPSRRMSSALLRLRRATPGVRGSLVTSTDGRPIVADLDGEGAGAFAALVASTLALGEQLGFLCGDAPLDELTVRTRHGYVVLTAVGTRHALAVVATPAANLARLGLALRDHVAVLLDLLVAEDELRSS